MTVSQTEHERRFDTELSSRRTARQQAPGKSRQRQAITGQSLETTSEEIRSCSKIKGRSTALPDLHIRRALRAARGIDGRVRVTFRIRWPS